jgi:putative transposase
MRRVAPSVIAREQLQELLSDGVGRESNVVSALVETVTRLVVQELLEAEQADYRGGRGPYERRGEGQSGSRNGYEPARVRTAEGAFEVAVPQVRGGEQPFRPSLMGFLDGNSEVLERLMCEMYARGLSTRDVEDAFHDATGQTLISKSAVSEITDRLWEDYQSRATARRHRTRSLIRIDSSRFGADTTAGLDDFSSSVFISPTRPTSTSAHAEHETTRTGPKSASSAIATCSVVDSR